MEFLLGSMLIKTVLFLMRYHIFLYFAWWKFVFIMSILQREFVALSFIFKYMVLWAPLTKFLTPGLICKLSILLDDWLGWLIPANHQTCYIICRLTWKLKIWWIRSYDCCGINFFLCFSTIATKCWECEKFLAKQGFEIKWFTL